MSHEEADRSTEKSVMHGGCDRVCRAASCAKKCVEVWNWWSKNQA